MWEGWVRAVWTEQGGKKFVAFGGLWSRIPVKVVRLLC